MDISKLIEYVRLIEHSNFSSAASELNVAQPTLSRHIEDLERELGEKLVRRDRPLGITPSGRIVLKEATEIISHYNNMLRDISALRENPLGLVRVHDFLHYRFFEDVFCSAVEEIALLGCNFEVKLQPMPGSMTPSEAVASGNLDVAFSFSFQKGQSSYEAKVEGLEYVPIPNSKNVVQIGVRKDHWLAGRKTISLDDLRGVPILSPATSSYGDFRRALVGMCEANGFTPKFDLRATATHRMFYADDPGDACYILNGSSIDRLPSVQRRKLEMLEFEDGAVSSEMVLVHDGDSGNRAVSEFISVFLDAAKASC